MLTKAEVFETTLPVCVVPMLVLAVLHLQQWWRSMFAIIAALVPSQQQYVNSLCILRGCFISLPRGGLFVF